MEAKLRLFLVHHHSFLPFIRGWNLDETCCNEEFLDNHDLSGNWGNSGAVWEQQQHQQNYLSSTLSIDGFMLNLRCIISKKEAELGLEAWMKKIKTTFHRIGAERWSIIVRHVHRSMFASSDYTNMYNIPKPIFRSEIYWLLCQWLLFLFWKTRFVVYYREGLGARSLLRYR